MTITNIIGIVYPAYASIMAIETDENDDTEWLVYWIVFAGFSLLEFFIEYVIFWIPFFFSLKLCFLVWLMSPEYRGANVIYLSALPYLQWGKGVSSEVPVIDSKKKNI